MRGIYSTVTLAVYGHSVDKVHIREVEVPKKETVLSPKSCISNSSPPSPVTESLEQVRIECNGTNAQYESSSVWLELGWSEWRKIMII